MPCLLLICAKLLHSRVMSGVFSSFYSQKDFFIIFTLMACQKVFLHLSNEGLIRNQWKWAPVDRKKLHTLYILTLHTQDSLQIRILGLVQSLPQNVFLDFLHMFYPTNKICRCAFFCVLNRISSPPRPPMNFDSTDNFLPPRVLSQWLNSTFWYRVKLAKNRDRHYSPFFSGTQVF